MKTPTAVTEIQAQVQMGELGGFTTIDRHIYFFDTFFVLMERDDLNDFKRLKGADGLNQCPLEVRDDIADYVFLFDRQTVWNRTAKKEVLIENRSRELRITAKSKEDMFKILLFFHTMRRIYCNTHGLDISSTFDDSLEDNKYPYRSFSAVRSNTPVKWYRSFNLYSSYVKFDLGTFVAQIIWKQLLKLWRMQRNEFSFAIGKCHRVFT